MTSQFFHRPMHDRQLPPATRRRDPVGHEGGARARRASEHGPGLERGRPAALLPDQSARRPALPPERPPAVPRRRRDRRGDGSPSATPAHGGAPARRRSPPARRRRGRRAPAGRGGPLGAERPPDVASLAPARPLGRSRDDSTRPRRAVRPSRPTTAALVAIWERRHRRAACRRAGAGVSDPAADAAARVGSSARAGSRLRRPVAAAAAPRARPCRTDDRGARSPVLPGGRAELAVGDPRATTGRGASCSSSPSATALGRATATSAGVVAERSA